MSIEAMRAALMADFKANFKTAPVPPAVAAAPFPVRYPNMPFTQPDGQPWGSASITVGERFFSAVGKQETRAMGIFFLQVFVEEEGGTSPAYQAADIVARIWDGKTLAAGPGGTVLFWTASLREIGKTNSGWYQVNVEAPFQFDTQTA